MYYCKLSTRGRICPICHWKSLCLIIELEGGGLIWRRTKRILITVKIIIKIQCCIIWNPPIGLFEHKHVPGHGNLHIWIFYKSLLQKNRSHTVSRPLLPSPPPLLGFTTTPVTCHLFFIWLPVGNSGQHSQLGLCQGEAPGLGSLAGGVVTLMWPLYKAHTVLMKINQPAEESNSIFVYVL